MTTEAEILFKLGRYWVVKAKHGYEVYKSGITHSVRVSSIGFEGKRGLDKAILECKRSNEQLEVLDGEKYIGG